MHHESIKGFSEAKIGGSNRQFGLVMAAFFLLVAGWSLWMGGDLWRYYLIAVLGFGFVAMVRPTWLAPFNRAWTWIGLWMSRIIDPITLAFIFFLLVTPMAMLARALGKDFLRLRFDPRASSYWIDRAPPAPPPGGMKNQF